MKHTGKCPKCGSVDVCDDAMTFDRGPGGPSDLVVASFTGKGFWGYKGGGATALSAWVCRDCGYVELYADSPKNLWRDKTPAE